jgi:hypothetical protein
MLRLELAQLRLEQFAQDFGIKGVVDLSAVPPDMPLSRRMAIARRMMVALHFAEGGGGAREQQDLHMDSKQGEAEEKGGGGGGGGTLPGGGRDQRSDPAAGKMRRIPPRKDKLTQSEIEARLR